MTLTVIIMEHLFRCCFGSSKNKITPSHSPELDNDNEKCISNDNPKLNGLLTPGYSMDSRTSDAGKDLSIRTASSVLSSESQSNRDDDNSDELKDKSSVTDDLETRNPTKQTLPKLQYAVSLFNTYVYSFLSY